MANKAPNPSARGTPIFDDRDENKDKPKPGSSGDNRNRAAAKQPKGDTQEIAREQGSRKDTPQRDHERERKGPKPAGSNAPAADVDSPNIRPEKHPSNAQADEDLPDGATGVRKNSSDIDDAHKPR